METFGQREHEKWWGSNVSSVKIQIKQPAPLQKTPDWITVPTPWSTWGCIQSCLRPGPHIPFFGLQRVAESDWLIVWSHFLKKYSVGESSHNTEGFESCSPIISKLQGRNVRIKWKSIILCWKFHDVPTKVPALETGACSALQEYKKICESTEFLDLCFLMGPTESKPKSWYHYWHGHFVGFAFKSSMLFPALFLSELLVNNWRQVFQNSRCLFRFSGL